MTSNPTESAQLPAGVHTRYEIINQAESWRGAADAVQSQHARIANFLAQNHARPALFIACGSPYYLGMTAAAMYRTLAGRPAGATPASDLLFHTDSVVPPGQAPVVFAVSRSGETSELLAACRKLKSAGSPLLAITVAPHSSLHDIIGAGDAVVSIPNAAEQSMAQTRSFSAMLIAALGAIAIGAGRRAVADEIASVAGNATAVASYLERIDGPVQRLIAHGFRQVYVLGSGARYGLANEGALKMKEMSLTSAEPFHFLEFRHGPQSMVDEKTLVIGLVSERGYSAEVQVLREMRALGGGVLAVTPKPIGGHDPGMVEIAVGPEMSETAGLPFYMPPLQLAAYHQAMAKGLNCDAPRNLKHYIELPELAG